MQKSNYTILFFLTLSLNLTGQKFNFGTYAQAIFSQIDGDNLKGYNKVGYDIGIEGGFEFDNHSSFLVRQGLSKLGSRSKSSDLLGFSNWLARFELTTLNAMVGYKYGSGFKRRESQNTKYFRIGLKSHFILKDNIEILNRTPEIIEIEDGQLQKVFFAINFGMDFKIYEKLFASLNYESAISNIISGNINFVSSKPYYFSVGISYGF